MNFPGAPTGTVGELINRVVAALQNRSDASESNPNPDMRPSRWLRDSIREITENPDYCPFEELRQPNPPNVTIGPGLGYKGSSYKFPVSQFLNSTDDVTFMEDPVIFLDPPANTVSFPMNYMTPKAIATLLNIPGGIPYNFTRYGDQFWFGVQPGQKYTVYLPYQLRHPFVDDNIANSPLYLPYSWHDIAAYAAAERGAIALRWNDQADFLHVKLFGDPKSMTRDGTLGMPGLIAARIPQQQRDRRLSPIAVTPVVSRY